MNSKKFILLLSCAVTCVFSISTAAAQMMGHRASTSRMPMHRAPTLGSPSRMPMHPASTMRMPIHPASISQMPMHRASTSRMPIKQAPIRNSASRFQPSNRLRTFNTFNDRDFDEDDGFRRFNDIIVFDTFGFPFFSSFSPFFPFYYPYPYYYPYGPYYPYGYGGYGYLSSYGGYGYQGGYGVNSSLVVQVQHRLASSGYYSGPIDGVVGSGTRRAIRAYERSHGLPVDGQIHRRLLATMGLA